MGKTSSAVKNRYAAKAYDAIHLTIPKGQKAVFQAACAENGDTMNGVLKAAIVEYLERHGQKREPEEG